MPGDGCQLPATPPEETRTPQALLAAADRFADVIAQQQRGLGLPVSADGWIAVSIREQTLWVYWETAAPLTLATADAWARDGNRVVAQYRCSTSAAPPSQVEGSLGTSRGLHSIAAVIGHEAPLGTVFRGREPVGMAELPPPSPDAPNLITTRILRLKGLEPGWNAGQCRRRDLPSAEQARAGEGVPEDLVSVDAFGRYLYLDRKSVV